MANTIERKCAKCKGTIVIDVDDVKNAIWYDGKYFHHDCFIDRANRMAKSKRSNAKEWQYVLDHLHEIESESILSIRQYYGREILNEWLLEHYDISVVPSYFWQFVAKLRKGEYRSKKCKPILADTLCYMWRWGQSNLDKIAASNKNKNKGPADDVDRLQYDLAILLSHTNEYMKHVTRSKEEAAKIAERVETAKKIDYEKIYQQSKKEEKQDNILDLMNDIF